MTKHRKNVTPQVPDWWLRNHQEKFKYSELTLNDKLHLADEVCWIVLEDWPSDQFLWTKTPQWYNLAMRIFQDCGYDISELSHVDWDNIVINTEVFRLYSCDIDRRCLNISYRKDHAISLLEQIIMD